MQTQTNSLFTELSAKCNATEIAIAKKLITELKTIIDLLKASE